LWVFLGWFRRIGIGFLGIVGLGSIFFGHQKCKRDFDGANSAHLSGVKGIDSKRDLLNKPPQMGLFDGFLPVMPKR